MPCVSSHFRLHVGKSCSLAIDTTFCYVLQVPLKGPVDLWWPRGYGQQPLYDLTVSYQPKAVANATQAPEVVPGSISTVQRRIGLRQINLVRDQIDNVTETFFFEVNGLPIFIKGTLLPMQVVSKLNYYLKQMTDSNCYVMP